MEQEISDSSNDDDVCRGSYITGVEHFVCHSYKVKEGDMNTSHNLKSHVQHTVVPQQITASSPRQASLYGSIYVNKQHVCHFRVLLKAYMSLLEIQLFTIV